MSDKQANENINSYAIELSREMAFRQRQFAAISNFVLVAGKMAITLPELKREAQASISTLSASLGLDHLLGPAVDKLAGIQSERTLEDALGLSIASAVVLAHSIFEDLLHSAANLSFRANPLWWRKTVLSLSTTKYSIQEVDEKGFGGILAAEEASFLPRWRAKSLINKLDSFLSVHNPTTTRYGDEIFLDRDAIVSIDKTRHEIIHKDVFSSTSDTVLIEVFGTIYSGRFILRLLSEPQWIGVDPAALLASTPTMTGVSNDVMNAVASDLVQAMRDQNIPKVGNRD